MPKKFYIPRCVGRRCVCPRKRCRCKWAPPVLALAVVTTIVGALLTAQSDPTDTQTRWRSPQAR